MPIRWLFFDVGYTLVDESEAQGRRVMQIVSALSALGVTVSEATVRQHIGEAARDFAPSPVTAAIRRLTGSEEQYGYVKERAKYDHRLEGLYPGTREVLSDLARSYRIGVIANQSAGTLERLDRLGLGPYVTLCVSSTEAGVEKPDLGIYRLALERAGCIGAESVMVGDRLDNDVRPAKELGFWTVRVLRWPSSEQQPTTDAYRPHFTLTDLADLHSVLRQMNR